MTIDVAPYQAPIKEAEAKPKGDVGDATSAGADLTGLSRGRGGYSNRHQQDASRLQADWFGDRGDLFGVRAKEHTEALDGAAHRAEKTSQTITDATSLIQQAEQEVGKLVQEFHGDAQTLVSAAAASTNPGAEQQARAVISGMSAEYARRPPTRRRAKGAHRAGLGNEKHPARRRAEVRPARRSH